MKENDLFINIDELAQDFPILTDEEKERMYTMSERKYNITDSTNTDFNTETEVSGVERYKRPKWRTASIAASLALLIGAGSFGGYNISKQLKNGDNDVPDGPTTSSEDMSQALTETAEDPRTEEYRQTAESLLAEYEDFLEPFDYDIMPKYPDEDMNIEEINKMSEEEYTAYLDKIDKERQRIDEEAGQSFDCLYYELGNGDPLDYPNYTFLGCWQYQRYEIGMKFINTDEVMDKALSFMSQSLIDKQFPKLIGEELTNYESNRTYRQDIEQCPDFGTYAMLNGKLYCNALDRDAFNSQKIPSSYRFYNCQNEPIVITDIEDSSFTATVKYEFTNVPNKYDMSMKVVNRDGKWIIDDIEPTGPELDAQKLDIVDKMMNSVKLYDKISAKNAHFEKIPENSSDMEMDYSVSYLILCADNRAAKSYDFGYYGDGYNGSDDITSMTEYAKKNIDPEHEKESEDYCDGEKRYYWHNPIDLDGDESNGKEYEWYDWNNYFYRDSNADKYKGFEAIRLNSTHDVSYDSSIYKNALCPDGIGLVTKYLCDFSTWNITGEINFEGIDCYIIEGKRPEREYEEYDEYGKYKYMLYIDKETGIPMLDISYLENGDIDSIDMYYDVKLNDKAEPVPEIDMNQYDLSRFNYK